MESKIRLLKEANAVLFTAKEERELIEKTQQGDNIAKDELLRGNIKLILMVAMFFYKKTPFTPVLSLADLFQEGSLGFLHAVKNFDLESGGRLSTYSMWCIKHYILMLIYRKAPLIYVPTKKINLIKKARAEIRNNSKIYLAENDCVALTAFLKQQFPDASKDDIFTFLLAVATYSNSPRSLDKAFSEDEETAAKELRKLEAISFKRWQNSKEPYPADLEKIEAFINNWCLGLKPREKEIIELMYGLNGDSACHSIQEVANKLNIKFETARQRLNMALRSLKSKAKLMEAFLEAFPA